MEMDEVLISRCRACARILQESSEEKIFLFEQNISEMFTNCTSLEIALNDSLPSHICFECFGHLSDFNQFRQNCVNSDTFLREQIVTESIKVERIDETGIQYEGTDENIKSEFYDRESECIDEHISELDLGSVDPIPVASTNDTNPSTFDSTKFICDYCGKEFDRKNCIASHMTKHKNEMLQKPKAKPSRISEKIPCTSHGCKKVFKKRNLFNNHRLKVHQIKATEVTAVDKKLRLRCQLCPKFFKIQHKLDAHVRGDHEGLTPYKCPHCEKEFRKSRAYVHHLRFRHSTEKKEKKFVCSYDGCDKEYEIRESLRVHINRCHLGIKKRKIQNLICEQCGRSFKAAFNLKKHMYTHSGLQPFACKICPRKFCSNYRLKIHTMRHLKVKPFECPTCGARKTTNKELQTHLNFHSKAISYPCKECPRVFTSYGAVSRHVRIHHRNHKPYICPHCDRAFTKAETLKNHVMTHTGEKPFACSECGHRFIQSVALKAHMKVHAKK